MFNCFWDVACGTVTIDVFSYDMEISIHVTFLEAQSGGDDFSFSVVLAVLDFPRCSRFDVSVALSLFRFIPTFLPDSVDVLVNFFVDVRDGDSVGKVDFFMGGGIFSVLVCFIMLYYTHMTWYPDKVDIFPGFYCCVSYFVDGV